MGWKRRGYGSKVDDLECIHVQSYGGAISYSAIGEGVVHVYVKGGGALTRAPRGYSAVNAPGWGGADICPTVIASEQRVS